MSTLDRPDTESMRSGPKRGREGIEPKEDMTSIPVEPIQAVEPIDHGAMIGEVDAKIGNERSGLEAAWAAFGLKAPEMSAEIGALNEKRTRLTTERAGLRGAETSSRQIVLGAPVLNGEILGKDEEDPENPRVLGRFDELPIELGDVMRSLNLKLRRVIMGDKYIIDMPYKELEEMALLAAGDKYLDYNEREKLMFPDGPPPRVPNQNPEPREMKDITPRPPGTRAIERQPGKYLP